MFRAVDVYNASRALLNDSRGSIFTNNKLQPMLNQAMADLRIRMQVHNIPVSNETKLDLSIPAGTTEVIFNAVEPAPSLPVDLITPMMLWERTDGMDQDYVPMKKVMFLPPYVTPVNQLIYWQWADQKIKFVGANTDNNIRIDYVKNILPDIRQEDDPITVINAKSFLNYRTAALAARFYGENESRSGELNTTAQMELDNFLTIEIKGGQAISTRRRPFRAGWKLWNNGL